MRITWWLSGQREEFAFSIKGVKALTAFKRTGVATFMISSDASETFRKTRIYFYLSRFCLQVNFTAKQSLRFTLKLIVSCRTTDEASKWDFFHKDKSLAGCLPNRCSRSDGEHMFGGLIAFPDITKIVRRNKFSVLTFSEETLSETTRRFSKTILKRDPVALP